MAKQWVERKTPRYSTISFLLHYAYFNDYPKNKEKFIWGIPSKYENFKDREMSAITTCYIYDGSRKSIETADRVDQMFGGQPLKWLANKRHCTMILDNKQDKVVYGRIKMKDLYQFFCELYDMYAKYGSIRKRFELSLYDSVEERLSVALSILTPFKGNSMVAYNRRNLFIFMMAHCFDDYKVDEYQLVVPLYENQIATSKFLCLIPHESCLSRETAIELTDNLRWFSEQHPLTFWVGLTAYQNAVREEDRMLKKLVRKALVKRRKFRKR